MNDKIFYATLFTICSALAYVMLRDIWRKPNYTVTRKMIEKAEMEAFFGDDWEYDWDDDDEE